SSEMPLDPARRFVIVAASTRGLVPETNGANNGAFFRRLSVGAIAHGLELTGTVPAWEPQVAAALQRKGYATTIQFDWAAQSRLPIPGLAEAAGQRLAAQVRALATAIAAQPTDVIDVNFIGESRGATVVTQALSSLQLSPGPRNLQL